MGSAGASSDGKMNVFIWDMDETLILLQSLINGNYAEAFNGLKNVKNGREIGKIWENQILQICDDYFFYEQIENFNQPHLDVTCQYDDGQDLSDYDFDKDGFGALLDDVNKRKLAYRHRTIANNYRKGLYGILEGDMIKSWENLYQVTDSYTDKWLSSARMCLEECANGNRDLIPNIVLPATANHAMSTENRHVNILVTSGALIPSLVKCLLFRLDGLLTCENVYSSCEVGKHHCFSLIKKRFSGPDVQFCVIGDGWEECEAAETMKWPFVKVDHRPTGYRRFPGLTLRDIDLYFSVVYGNADEKDDEE